jgi:cytochrome c
VLSLLLALAAPLAGPSFHGQGVAVRPRDPWVFRCVLDRRPRMVTLALSDELWLAYDAEQCGLYKVWKGGVQFDGAVYTSVHGPQPTSVGPTYTLGAEGELWSIAREGQVRTVKARYRGHVFSGGQVKLVCELPLDDGGFVRVEETPEVVRSERLFEDPSAVAPWLDRGLVGLRRSFATSGLPAGASARLRVRADCRGYLIDRLLELEETAEDLPNGTRVRHVSGLLPLDANAPANELILFFDAPVPEPSKK